MKILGILFITLVSVSITLAMGLSPPPPKTLWHPFHFDGSGFRAGIARGMATVLVRDGYLPFVRHNGSPIREERLPEGTGAVGGICYIQAVGGKLREGSGVLPMEGAEVTFHGGNKRLAVRTGTGGFFAVALPPGDYSVMVSGSTRNVRVDEGRSNLIAIRGGKRMVD